jgi:hypothetical protein
MSPLRVVFGVVVLCFVAWLAALVFVPRLLPAFLLPPGFKAGGGGDDQPPIIISDGSVMLLTRGQWRDDMNANAPHFVSENYPPNSNDAAAAFMTVLVDGGVDSSGDSKCPSDAFVTTKLTLYSGNTTHDLELDLVTGDADYGKLRINHGNEVPKTKHRIDLGGSLASVTRLTANNDAVDCSFPTLGSREFILVLPHR